MPYKYGFYHNFFNLYSVIIKSPPFVGTEGAGFNDPGRIGSI